MKPAALIARAGDPPPDERTGAREIAISGVDDTWGDNDFIDLTGWQPATSGEWGDELPLYDVEEPDCKNGSYCCKNGS